MDSATVRGSLPFLHTHEQTVILRIDGAWRGVTLTPNLYLSPGKHELAVNTVYLADPDDDSESSKTTSIDAVFQANHQYIVERSENHLLLLLYDETGGDKKSILVGQWEIGVKDYFYEEP